MKVQERELAKSIGRAISKRRLACKLTQEQVAEQLSIGYEAVSRMERGTVMPTVARLIELAKIFDCPVGDLLIESSNRSEEQGEFISSLIKTLREEDRRFVLEILEKFTVHLNR
ncbi:helix-turn-helix domain-containing protein [Undibacterium sp. WLX3042]|uniref:helix-turn-helix domain-containing protein n=1 Tax=Undibacterium sp. WLX3042 TaxID=3412686 RepID=UPI003C2C90F4